MTKDFPRKITDFLPIFEVLAPTHRGFEKLVEFIRMKLPDDGFPVKLGTIFVRILYFNYSYLSSHILQSCLYFPQLQLLPRLRYIQRIQVSSNYRIVCLLYHLATLKQKSNVKLMANRMIYIFTVNSYQYTVNSLLRNTTFCGIQGEIKL